MIETAYLIPRDVFCFREYFGSLNIEDSRDESIMHL